jgi:hypothetical protein
MLLPETVRVSVDWIQPELPGLDAWIVWSWSWRVLPLMVPVTVQVTQSEVWPTACEFRVPVTVLPDCVKLRVSCQLALVPPPGWLKVPVQVPVTLTGEGWGLVGGWVLPDCRVN